MIGFVVVCEFSFIVCFLQVAVNGSFLSLSFLLEIFLMHLMILGSSFKTGGLISSRSKVLNLWMVLLGMVTWMWLGHLGILSVHTFIS